MERERIKARIAFLEDLKAVLAKHGAVIESVRGYYSDHYPSLSIGDDDFDDDFYSDQLTDEDCMLVIDKLKKILADDTVLE